jgi:hypothetical protein
MEDGEGLEKTAGMFWAVHHHPRRPKANAMKTKYFMADEPISRIVTARVVGKQVVCFQPSQSVSNVNSVSMGSFLDTFWSRF